MQLLYHCSESDIQLVSGGGGGGGADQLTLLFQGEVQAVLLLLGGYEVPTGAPTLRSYLKVKGYECLRLFALTEFPARSSQPQRAASLSRFREKRKERCFDKKIRYTIRKEVALRMQRKKGQFTSSKAVSDEAGSATSDWNGGPGQDEETMSIETLWNQLNLPLKLLVCYFFGQSSTPMMRRGPSGPRTLCNACGTQMGQQGSYLAHSLCFRCHLLWTLGSNILKVGVLRDLNKVSALGSRPYRKDY
ncbi:putative transcription factor C2C2-GATA family [Helianthus debilis subsp. tardiflorus]